MHVQYILYCSRVSNILSGTFLLFLVYFLKHIIILTFRFFGFGCFVIYSSAVDSDDHDQKHNVELATSGQPENIDVAVLELSQYDEPSSSDALLDRSFSLLSATTAESERYFE